MQSLKAKLVPSHLGVIKLPATPAHPEPSGTHSCECSRAEKQALGIDQTSLALNVRVDGVRKMAEKSPKSPSNAAHRHTTISATSPTAPVVAQRRARQQPWPRTAPEPWNLCVFCTVLNCGHPLYNRKFAHSEDGLNLRHLQLEPLGLLMVTGTSNEGISTVFCTVCRCSWIRSTT